MYMYNLFLLWWIRNQPICISLQASRLNNITLLKYWLLNKFLLHILYKTEHNLQQFIISMTFFSYVDFCDEGEVERDPRNSCWKTEVTIRGKR